VREKYQNTLVDVTGRSFREVDMFTQDPVLIGLQTRLGKFASYDIGCERDSRPAFDLSRVLRASRRLKASKLRRGYTCQVSNIRHTNRDVAGKFIECTARPSI
jgi:hypothetical protein